jgi:membrane associated rhomboid family serine protease
MIPIATDTSIRRTPYANYALIAINVFIFAVDFLFGNATSGRTSIGKIIDLGVLHADLPELYQFITYQFLHGGTMHLLGNMLFLYVFGNPVNAKMGDAPYVFFYLACGVFAAFGFVMFNASPIVGASGSIAGITTAYLALFPRSHVTVLYWFYIIGTFEIPSIWLIIFKIILWDNIIAPGYVLHGESHVAYDAHLAGYAFGFIAIVLMLVFRLLPRDQFDIVAVSRRWLQRRSMRSAMADPNAQARAQYGRVARPVSANDMNTRPARSSEHDQVTQLRLQVNQLLAQNARDEAANAYAKLLELDSSQVLPRVQQLEIANQLYTQHRIPQAAAAYEKFLSQYPHAPEHNEVKLLLGIIYTRDLQQYEVGAAHLRQVRDSLADEKRLQQCRHWLSVASQELGRSEPEV